MTLYVLYMSSCKECCVWVNIGEGREIRIYKHVSECVKEFTSRVCTVQV